MPPAEPWPHWRELLDAPVPHADQLRSAISGGSGTEARSGSGSQQGSLTLRSAIRLARTGDAREFIPWPEADRRQPEREAPDRAGPTSPPGDDEAE
jgi:hypothetical protein